MIIGHNLLGEFAYRALKNTNRKTSKSIDRLSSGNRINYASDDATGLTISEGMRAQIRGLRQAIRNTQDAYSLIQTMDGVLSETTSILQRMRELTVQSLNGTLSDGDRSMIQEEFKALQSSISDFTKKSEWNTMPLFEPHKESFYNFEGNQKFTQLIKVIEGFNNDLEIVVDGISHKVSIDQGYYSVNEIVDILDTKLMDINPNLIIGLTEDKTVSLQAEDSLSIDYIKGGLSFLFYEYVQGRPPGMILGVTEFLESGKLNIISGSNDKLNFYVGADKQYTINFAPKAGGYNIDELISIINSQLQAKGETDVEAIKYNDKYIALYSNKYVITGLSGNMIKIDGITSVLYDNSRYGTVSKTRAQVTGKADLSDGIIIKKGTNDTLSFWLDDETELKTINLLELDGEEIERSYTLNQLLDKLNEELEKQKIEAFFSIITDTHGKHLQLTSKYFGDGSKIQVDTTSNVYNDFFVRVKETTIKSDPRTGSLNIAQVAGMHGISDNTEIIAGVNDTLTFKVTSNINGNSETITKSIILEEKNYSQEELIQEINNRLSEGNLNLTVTLSAGVDGTTRNHALVFKHNQAGNGNSFNIDSTSNAFETLLCEESILHPISKDGTTQVTYPPEGVVAPPIEDKTPAILTGRADLSAGVIIDSTNNELTFNISGQDVSITLDDGNYDSNSFLIMISNKLAGTGVLASLRNDLGYGTNLVFTTEATGKEQKFSNIGGSVYQSIFTRNNLNKPYNTGSSGTSSNSHIMGLYNIPNNFEINETNKDLIFDYIHEGNIYKINIELTEGIYSNVVSLVDELNNKIRENLAGHGFSVIDGENADIFVTGTLDNKIRIDAKNMGPSYRFVNSFGGFYDNVFCEKKVTIDYPTSNPSKGYSNHINNQIAYIVGREDLNKEMVIHPNINDILIFDFYHNSKKETFEMKLDPGAYNGSSIVAEIQRRLSQVSVNKGYDENLFQVQIGGVDSGTVFDDSNKLVIKYIPKNDGSDNNGTYIIDGVRGNAAYTVFYKAYGEPSPTHTIGIVDLSKGVEIQTGINDIFIMELNGVEKTIVLDEGIYTSEELLEHINTKLQGISANVVVSYYEGRLKLSFLEAGTNTIDGIRGSARETLFFSCDSRKSDLPKYFQIGPNSGDKIDFQKVRISGELMRINTIMIHTNHYAKKALSRLEHGINYISKERSYIGAMQNRLESVIRNNENYAENISASESRIKDADMAKEVMELIKNNIQQQATQAILAQTRQIPEGVLSLLR